MEVPGWAAGMSAPWAKPCTVLSEIIALQPDTTNELDDPRGGTLLTATATKPWHNVIDTRVRTTILVCNTNFCANTAQEAGSLAG